MEVNSQALDFSDFEHGTLDSELIVTAKEWSIESFFV